MVHENRHNRDDISFTKKPLSIVAVIPGLEQARGGRVMNICCHLGKRDVFTPQAAGDARRPCSRKGPN